MKVYEWRETEDHYIAVVSPPELFDNDTMELPAQKDHQAYLSARHVLTGEMEGCAIAYGKGWRKDFAEAHVKNIREVYLDRDIIDLSRTRLNVERRKTT